MNKTVFIRSLAIAMLFVASVGVQAQGLKGLGKKMKEKVTEEKSPEPASPPSGGTKIATQTATTTANWRVSKEQPWTLDDHGKVKATLVDGVLSIQGEGRVNDFVITMHDDSRLWASQANEIKTVVIGEGVTYLGSLAFYNCENITSITLPGTLTHIGGATFYGCKSLPTITFPKSLDHITTGRVPNDEGTQDPAGIFQQCTSLTEIKVEEGNAKYKAIDGVLYEFFSNKWRLKSYPPGLPATKFTVPDNTPVVQLGAFASCQAIKEVVLPVSCGEI